MLALTCAWDVCGSAARPSEELAALAERRWRSLVSFARECSAFYRDLYREVPATGPASLDALPPVTKGMLMRDFDRVVTDARLTRAAVAEFVSDSECIGQPFAGEFAVWTSSGTSGVPGVFVHDGNALMVYDALQLYRFRGAGAWLDWRTGPLSAGRFALVAATGGHFAGAASVARLRGVFPWIPQQMRVFSLIQPTPTLIAHLNAYQPDIIATYPTVASMLAREQTAGRLHIRPSQIWTGAECQSGAVRRQLQQVFGAQVRDEYGASEFSSIAADCPAGYLHVNADWVVLEPVDEHLRPISPGEASHSVLLTNLANRAQPLIRYDLGDSVTMRPGPCACGSRLPAMKLHGREDDLLELRDADGAPVQLMPLALTTVLEDDGGVNDFQLEQFGSNAVRLRLGPAESAMPSHALHALEALRSYLECQGLHDTRIEIADEPPRRAGNGGKLRRVVRACERFDCAGQ